MAKTSVVTFEELLGLINELEEKYSKKAIEDLFGIVIKEVDTESHLYNLYKDNELVYAKMPSYAIAQLFQSVIYRFITRMCKEAEQDDNSEGTEGVS